MHAGPFLIAAGYAAIVGVLANTIISLISNHRARVNHNFDIVGATSGDFAAFALWAVDLNQVITTAIVSPLFAAASGLVSSTAIQLLFVGTLVASVWLCILIATHDPQEYVNWASTWIAEKKANSANGVQPSLMYRGFVHVVTAIGVTWPTVTQLVAAGVAAFVASMHPAAAKHAAVFARGVMW